MDTAILLAQTLKIVSGVAQLGFALWLMIRGPRSGANIAFAIAFGANGIAYVLFNSSLPGQQRAEGSFALEGRAIFKWIAAAAMCVFVIAFVQSLQRRKAALLVAVPITLVILSAALLAARGHRLTPLEFGGIAIYPATGSALAVFPVLFRANSSEVRTRCAFLGAALAINSVDHLGAELIRPGPSPEATVLIQSGAMATIFGLWLWSARGRSSSDSRLVLLVVVCMVAAFAGGVLVRVAAGSYRGVQLSGFIGVGRVATTGLLVYGMLARDIFSLPGRRKALPVTGVAV